MAFKPFDYEWETTQSPAETRRWVKTVLTPKLATENYPLTTQDDESFVFTRRYAPGISIFLAIILFPIGLLFLLMRSTATIVVDVASGDGKGSAVIVTGRAPNRLRADLEQLGPGVPVTAE